jgi:formylglycine-generating enzyme required for sulfatase activity
MSPISSLVSFGLRQVMGETVGSVVDAIQQHFSDHSETLPKALGRANDRTWQAIAVALAGDGFIDRLKVFFASGDDKGVREQVAAFLKSSAVSFEGTPADFRRTCWEELKQLRKSGLLSMQDLPAATIARQAAEFQRYVDGKGLVEGATLAVGRVADALQGDYSHLSKLLRTPTPSGPPLLGLAFCYFFRREVETDEELAHGLFFDMLRQVTASHGKAFSEVNKALITFGERFDDVLDQLGRIEEEVYETRATATATHQGVLDIKVELQRMSGLHLEQVAELRSLLLQLFRQRTQSRMQRDELPPPDNFSVPNEDEQQEQPEVTVLEEEVVAPGKPSTGIFVKTGVDDQGNDIWVKATQALLVEKVVNFFVGEEGPERGELIRLALSLQVTCTEVEHPERANWQQRLVELLEQGVQPGFGQASVPVDEGLEITFTFIPPGSFLMGSPAEEEGRAHDEVQHEVTVENAFYLGIYPVTQAQWRAVMGDNPSHFSGDDHPVENVSWFDCEEFCRKLGEKTGRRFRLPTEAEWERACRAGTTTPYFFGEAISPDQANYNAEASSNVQAEGYRKQTTPVGSFLPNAWGLYDMHGNVAEWSIDGYVADRPANLAAVNEGGDEGNVVLRGGSWLGAARACRSASRDNLDPSDRSEDVGFRIILCSD